MFFKDIIGQHEVKQHLLTSLKTGRIGHAQLFAGDTGYGSFALAFAFARYILCTGDKKEDACGECLSCRHVSKLIHADLHFVFPVIKKAKLSVSDDFIGEWRNMLSRGPYFDLEDWYSEIGGDDNTNASIYTDESAAILRKLNLKSFESEYKIMLIWLPEKMNAECSNKLLKILEEPFEKTIFLLISEHPDQIISTILSRVQRINIPPLDRKEIAEGLAAKGVDIAIVEDYAHISAGNWHKALCLLHETEEQIYHQEKFEHLMRLCWERKMLPINEWVNELSTQGRERQKNFFHHAMRMIRENFMKNFGNSRLNYMTTREHKFSQNFSPYVNEGNVIPLSGEFERAYYDISRNGNAKIIFTDLCIKVMQNIRP